MIASALLVGTAVCMPDTPQDDRNFLMTVVTRAGTSGGDESKDASSDAGDATEQRVVLKVHNGVESLAVVEAQNALLVHLSKAGFNVPCPLPATDGALMTFVDLELAPAPASASGDASAEADVSASAEGKAKEDVSSSPTVRRHAVRMLRFVEGTVMSEVTPDLALIRKV